MKKKSSVLFLIIIFCSYYLTAQQTKKPQKIKPALNSKPTNTVRSLPQAIKSISNSTVKIVLSYQENGIEKSFTNGTGFFVNEDGYIITNNHVLEILINNPTYYFLSVGIVDQTKQATKDNSNVRFYNNTTVIQAKIIDRDKNRDLALLKLDINPFKENITSFFSGEKIIPKIPKFNKRQIEDGDYIAVSGFPSVGGDYLITNVGHIASCWLPNGNYLTDIQINHGNSGGPIYLAETGEVIGVAFATTLTPVEFYYKDKNEPISKDVLSRLHFGRYKDTVIDQKKTLELVDIIALTELRLLYNSGIGEVISLNHVIELAKKNGVKIDIK